MSDKTSFGGRQAGKTARLAAQYRTGGDAMKRGVEAYKSIASVLEQRSLSVHDMFAQARMEMLEQRPPMTISIDEASTIDQGIIDAVLYGQSASRLHHVTPGLDTYSDAQLVMHMIGRGYAVMKLPADGGSPEVLRS